MNEKVNEVAVVKILNTIGNELIKRNYNMDLTFEVMEVIDKTIYVKSSIDIPQVIWNHLLDDFTYSQLSNIKDMEMNLKHTLRYIGYKGEYGINLTKYSLNPEEVQFPLSDDALITNPTDFYVFEDNGTALVMETGDVYPVVHNYYIDTYGSHHISVIDDDEWWGSLTSNDKQMLKELYK